MGKILQLIKRSQGSLITSTIPSIILLMSCLAYSPCCTSTKLQIKNRRINQAPLRTQKKRILSLEDISFVWVEVSPSRRPYQKFLAATSPWRALSVPMVGAVSMTIRPIPKDIIVPTKQWFMIGLKRRKMLVLLHAYQRKIKISSSHHLPQLGIKINCKLQRQLHHCRILHPVLEVQITTLSTTRLLLLLLQIK